MIHSKHKLKTIAIWNKRWSLFLAKIKLWHKELNKKSLETETTELAEKVNAASSQIVGSEGELVRLRKENYNLYEKEKTSFETLRSTKRDSITKELQDSTNREHIAENAVKELKKQVEDILINRDKLSAACNFYINHAEELIAERNNYADDVVSV